MTCKQQTNRLTTYYCTILGQNHAGVTEHAPWRRRTGTITCTVTRLLAVCLSVGSTLVRHSIDEVRDLHFWGGGRKLIINQTSE